MGKREDESAFRHSGPATGYSQATQAGSESLGLPKGEVTAKLVPVGRQRSRMNAPDDFRIGSDNPGHHPTGDHVPAAFEFTSGGGDPGMGCRETGTVVARALPEFATRQVVTCYDRHLQMSIATTRWPLPSCQLDAYLAKQAVPDHPANSLDEN